MAYKPAYIWNGTSFDQIGSQAVASLNDYALLSPVVGQTLSNTTLTSPTVNGATLSGTLSGNHTVSGNTTFSGSNTHSGNLAVTGRLDVEDIRETVNDATITTNLLTADYSTGTIFYVGSAPSANFTVNLTNAPTDNGKAITVTVIVTQGATGYIPNALQVAGSAQTIKWVGGGTAPTPTSSAGKIDIFNFTLIRRSSAWTVFGNASVNF